MRREGVRSSCASCITLPAWPQTVAQRTGAKLVELPAMVGGVPEAQDYVSFIDYNVRTMLKAVDDQGRANYHALRRISRSGM